MINQARTLLNELHSSGRVNYNEYVLLWETLDELENSLNITQENYERVRQKLLFAQDKLKTERNELGQTIIRFNCAIDDIREALT